MKKVKGAIVVFLALGLFCSGAWAMHHAVKIQQKEGLGKYLTDTEGKTLYWFKKDASDKSACTGACVEKWPIYYRETVAPPAGLSPNDFGTITREDGKKQTTFRKYPLYYWVNDVNPGDINGQGVNNVWFVINPDDFPPKK